MIILIYHGNFFFSFIIYKLNGNIILQTSGPNLLTIKCAGYNEKYQGRSTTTIMVRMTTNP